MGRISHLVNDKKPQPAKYQLEGVISSIADIMSQSVSESVYPHIAALSAQSTKTRSESARERQKATDEIKKAVSEAVSALKPEIARVLEALDAKSADMAQLQSRLVDALSNVRIPDYSDQLARLESAQPDLGPVLDAVRSIEFPEMDERPLEWEFVIDRHSSGLIKSVTAKAK